MSSEKDKLVDALLQERDELYQELSRLQASDNGSLDQAEKKNERYEAVIKEAGKIVKTSKPKRRSKRKMEC